MAIATMTRYDLPAILDGEEVWCHDRFDVRYPYTGKVIGPEPKLARGRGVRPRTRPRRRGRPVAAPSTSAMSPDSGPS